MESTLGSVLIGALALGVGLYLIWQILNAIDQYRARRYWKARRQRGESSFCLHDPSTGSIIRVRRPKD